MRRRQEEEEDSVEEELFDQEKDEELGGKRHRCDQEDDEHLRGRRKKMHEDYAIKGKSKSGGTLIGAIHVKDGIVVFADSRASSMCPKTGSIILEDFTDKYEALPPYFRIFCSGNQQQAQYLVGRLKEELIKQTVLSANPSVLEVGNYLAERVKAKFRKGKGTGRFENLGVGLLIIKNVMEEDNILCLDISLKKDKKDQKDKKDSVKVDSVAPSRNEVAFIGTNPEFYTKYFMERFQPTMSMDKIAELGRETLEKAAMRYWYVGGHAKIQILSFETKAWSSHSCREMPNRKRHQIVESRDLNVKGSEKIKRKVIYDDASTADFLEPF